MSSEENLPGEEWRDVVGWSGWYSVSCLGRVRRDMPGTFTLPGLILRQQNINGYLVVQLQRTTDTWARKHIKRTCPVHRLVYEAFVGQIPVNHVVRHKDGDSANNVPDNLYCIPRGECMRMVNEGNRKNAVTPELEKRILEMLSRGERRSVIARETGLGEATITRVKQKYVWTPRFSYKPKEKAS